MIKQGDCLDVLREMDADSIDAIVTDPPYGLEFMGKDWDSFRVDPRSARWSGQNSGAGGAGFGESHLKGAVLPAFHRRRTTCECRRCGKRDAFRNPHPCDPNADWHTIHVDVTPIEARAFGAFCEAWGEQVLRVLKPGGHLLAFGGTRTYHRLACALEDVGFDVRDCLMWIYGSGFPKSLDVGKAIDKEAGAEREVLGYGPTKKSASPCMSPTGQNRPGARKKHEGPPVSDAAERWDGWGTALKPAYEPIVLARKPLAESSIAGNVLRHGTGALNVDGCRIEGVKPKREAIDSDKRNNAILHTRSASGTGETTMGRWPANVVLDEEAARMLDEQSGQMKDGVAVKHNTPQGKLTGHIFKLGNTGQTVGYGGGGGASRFFYCAKASRGEREPGRSGKIANDHPTVKPVALMRWLCRLITPPGGHVLDPFLGSGTTALACAAEGFRFTGLEIKPEYEAIAKKRLFWRTARVK